MSDIENPPLSETPGSQTGTTVAFLLTALIFFALGLVIAAILGLSVTDKEPTQETIAQAVEGTLIALTPTLTPTPTAVPVQMTYSEDRDYVRGAADAPVTIVEFSDYQCPYCGRFALQTLKPLLDTYGDQVRFIYRDFPILGDASLRAAHAAQCADRQERFWDYHDILFLRRNQPERLEFTDDNLVAFADELGLDKEAFTTCLADTSISQNIVQNLIDGESLLGQAGTPTFLINGRRLVGALPMNAFVQIIDEELASLGVDRPTN